MEVTFYDRVRAYNSFIESLNDLVPVVEQTTGENLPKYPKHTVDSLPSEMLESWLDSWESAHPGFRDQFEQLSQITAKNRREAETMLLSLRRTEVFVVKLAVTLWVAGTVFWIALAISRV